MRVALITEGTYPYRTASTSTWCHQLVTGLDRHTYHLVALTTTAGDAARPAYQLPGNIADLTPVPVWGAPASPAGRLARLRTRRTATTAAVRLCRGLLGDDTHHAALFRDGLTRLAGLATGGIHPLAGTPLADVLADAWGVSSRAGSAARLPRLTLRDAGIAATLLEHALRPLAVTLPDTDLCHATAGGLPLLVALATRWRAGTPYLLSEQGIYLRERYLDYTTGVPPAVRELMLRFFRALSKLGYAEAALVTGASRFHQRWQLRHGAHPARVVVVPAGADPAAFPVCPHRPESGPTVVWLGRIEPLQDLHTLLRAFRRVRRELPQARLRLAGPIEDEQYAAGCRALTRRLDLTGAVQFTGPVGHPADAYAAGQVVVRTSAREGTPYGVLEAMLSGRATVCTDVGGVGELVGGTGLLAPPGDPAAFADALLSLLRDPARCRSLGEAAARRARTELSADALVRAYQQLYVDAADREAP